MQEAQYYQAGEDHILCQLCPQACRLTEGAKGICGVRQEKNGQLFSLNYNRCVAAGFDPIEKKPLYHFYPGWEILSVGTFGCNLQCTFCQNWTLARGEAVQLAEAFTSKDLLELLQNKPPHQQLGVAYTYNEPTVWYEFVYEASSLLAQHGYKNVLVTNGLINPEPLKALIPFVHALNIDVKSFTDSFYRKQCRGRGLAEVKRTVEYSSEHCHIELTYLVIPTLNDSMEEIERFVEWVSSVNREIPVHFTRYAPSYQMDLPPTSTSTLYNIWKYARETLPYVYLGNIMDAESSTTFCPSCHTALLRRMGFRVENPALKEGKCEKCGSPVNIVGTVKT